MGVVALNFHSRLIGRNRWIARLAQVVLYLEVAKSFTTFPLIKEQTHEESIHTRCDRCRTLFHPINLGSR